MKLKILVVDDEEKIRNIVRMYFTKEGFVVDEAINGIQALEKLSSDKYDLIILDIMMPGVDGWTVCREVRAKSSVPIIMLTAKGEEVDRIVGLEMGADDYVVKPFSPRELLARVKAVLRRTDHDGNSDKKGPSTSDANKIMEIDPETRSVFVCGQPVLLTVKEFDLILFMSKNPGRAFCRDELLQGVWGFDYCGDTRTVDTHINRLRDKLNKVPGCPDIIRTVWGVGYKYEVVE